MPTPYTNSKLITYGTKLTKDKAIELQRHSIFSKILCKNSITHDVYRLNQINIEEVYTNGAILQCIANDWRRFKAISKQNKN